MNSDGVVDHQFIRDKTVDAKVYECILNNFTTKAKAKKLYKD